MKMLLPVVVIATSLVGCALSPDNLKRQGGSDINNPGSWAYEGCKQGLLTEVRYDHPQVQSIQIDGHVTEYRETDHRSTLSGKAKYNKNGDMRHITFECAVDPKEKKILKVKYDKS